MLFPGPPGKLVTLGGETLGWIDLHSNSEQPFSYIAAPRAPAVDEPAVFGGYLTLEGGGSPLITLVPEVPFFPGSPYNTMQKCEVIFHP